MKNQKKPKIGKSDLEYFKHDHCMIKMTVYLIDRLPGIVFMLFLIGRLF